jgi:hypothetical protein
MTARRLSPPAALAPLAPEDALPLGRACALALVAAPDGRRATPALLRRWARAGWRAAAGARPVRFPAARVGGRLVTTPGWCSAFAAEVSAPDGAEAARQRAGGAGARKARSPSGPISSQPTFR